MINKTLRLIENLFTILFAVSLAMIVLHSILLLVSKDYANSYRILVGTGYEEGIHLIGVILVGCVFLTTVLLVGVQSIKGGEVNDR